MSKSNHFYIVSDGYTYSKHKTKEEALVERELKKHNGYLNCNDQNPRYYIKKIKGYSIIYGGQ